MLGSVFVTIPDVRCRINLAGRASKTYHPGLFNHHMSILRTSGKLCMLQIDTDRALRAEELGYSVTLCSLVPSTCSPKNDLLIGTKVSQVRANFFVSVLLGDVAQDRVGNAP